MPQVRVSALAAHLNSFHEELSISTLDNIFRIQRLRETGPTRAGFIFIFRTKERLAGDFVDVDPLLVIVEVGVLKRRLRPLVVGHIKREWIEFHAEDVFGRFLERMPIRF